MNYANTMLAYISYNVNQKTLFNISNNRYSIGGLLSWINQLEKKYLIPELNKFKY